MNFMTTWYQATSHARKHASTQASNSNAYVQPMSIFSSQPNVWTPPCRVASWWKKFSMQQQPTDLRLSLLYAIPRYGCRSLTVLLPFFPTGTMERLGRLQFDGVYHRAPRSPSAFARVVAVRGRKNIGNETLRCHKAPLCCCYTKVIAIVVCCGYNSSS